MKHHVESDTNTTVAFVSIIFYIRKEFGDFLSSVHKKKVTNHYYNSSLYGKGSPASLVFQHRFTYAVKTTIMF